MKVIQLRSPNQNARPAGSTPSLVVLHADADDRAKDSARYCCDPASKVSYTTIVERDGTVYALVDSKARAWHAGFSEFDGVPDCNDYSLGLCFSNKQDGKEPFTQAQLEAGALVVAGWIALYPAITLERITTHAVVATCDKGCHRAHRCHHYPRGRKSDPGPLFPIASFRALVATAAGIPAHTGA